MKKKIIFNKKYSSMLTRLLSDSNRPIDLQVFVVSTLIGSIALRENFRAVLFNIEMKLPTQTCRVQKILFNILSFSFPFLFQLFFTSFLYLLFL